MNVHSCPGLFEELLLKKMVKTVGKRLKQDDWGKTTLRLAR